MGQCVREKLRPIVKGRASGPIVKVDALSFYGEVDPERGVIMADGREIADRVLVIGRSRGSTVGSYILYALKYYGKAPQAIVMRRSEPIVIVGALLAGIPLYEGLTGEAYAALEDGMCAIIDEDGTLEACPCASRA